MVVMISFITRLSLLAAPVFGSLVYEADMSVQVRLRDYTMSRVFSTIDEDDDAEEDDEGL